MRGTNTVQRSFGMAQNEYLSNFSYIFIPFSLEKAAHFIPFDKAIKDSGQWEPVGDKIQYLHRYVSDRLVSRETNGETIASMFRYRFKKSCGADAGLFFDRPYRTAPTTFQDEENVTFDFRIADVQLFLFNTTVCVMAFRLQFENDDPLHIAAAQYHLRKIDKESIYATADNGTESSGTFMDLSQKILEAPIRAYPSDFFFYAAKRNARANFLTYIDIPRQDDIERKLYYLKWCYHDGFDYEPCCEEQDAVNYMPDPSKHFGISPSAAVCMVHRTRENREFVENTFQKNFRDQYFFTYVLLLHQKYMMYLFLTKMSVGIDNNLELLESYKQRLYEFETKYMFSRVSEVPQYQRFYDKVKQAFSLKEMFSDVQEPLARLVEIQRQQDTARQAQHEKRLSSALGALSLLAIFSALTDAMGVVSELYWDIPLTVARVIQGISVGTALVIIVFSLSRLISLKSKRKACYTESSAAEKKRKSKKSEHRE